MDSKHNTSEEQSPAEVMRGLQDAIDRIGALGVRVHPQGRFSAYLRVLERAAHGDATLTPERTQADLEVSQLVRISQMPLLSSPPARLVEKLRQVLSDPILPGGPEEESPGRDTQFELFLASIFDSGGFQVALEEPDLVVVVDGARVGIAAKRMKSRGKLYARFKKAREQLVRRSGDIAHGFIALDVTDIPNPGRAVAISAGSFQGSSAAAQLTVAVEQDVVAAARQVLAGVDDLRLTCCAVLFAGVVHYFPDDGGVINSINLRAIGFDAAHRELRARLASVLE